ncbi:MAG: hypothetical protein WCI79_00030 [Candidatus Saccharibacteria bacterium]
MLAYLLLISHDYDMEQPERQNGHEKPKLNAMEVLKQGGWFPVVSFNQETGICFFQNKSVEDPLLSSRETEDADVLDGYNEGGADILDGITIDAGGLLLVDDETIEKLEVEIFPQDADGEYGSRNRRVTTGWGIAISYASNDHNHAHPLGIIQVSVIRIGSRSWIHSEREEPKSL